MNVKTWSNRTLEEVGAELAADIAAGGSRETVRDLKAQLAEVRAEWVRRFGNETAEDRYARGIGPAVPAVNAVVRGIW